MSVNREDRGQIAILTISDPDHGNALTQETVDSLVTHLDQVERDGQGCAIITGTGRFFCAGGDVDDLLDWGSWQPIERLDYLDHGPHQLARALRGTGLATVAAINGAAFGAGLDLTLLCDVRVASTEARFCESYINVGVVPGDGGTWLLPRYIGLGRAMHFLLTGEEFSAEDALELGVVTRLGEPEEMMEMAITVAERLASRTPRARRMIRDMVLGAAGQTLEQHFDQLGPIMATIAGSDEHREALQEVMGR